MKMFLISDNIDTAVGLRFAGIDGIVVHEKAEVEREIDSAVANEEYAVVLVTEKLYKLADAKINEIKLSRSTPLFVTIPDRHGQSDQTAIERYIREAIGLKI